MSRKSKYTGGFRPKKYESRIPFPYVVFDDKKEVLDEVKEQLAAFNFQEILRY